MIGIFMEDIAVPMVHIVIPLAVYVGAILIIYFSFKRIDGSIAKKGLYTSGFLGLYLTLTSGFVRMSPWHLIAPILAFTVLSVMSLLEKKQRS